MASKPKKKQSSSKKTRSPAGRLSALGAQQKWHIPLILPEDYRDYRFPVNTFLQEHLDGKKRLYHLKKIRGLSATPKWVKKGKVPLRTMRLADARGLQVIASIFGDTRDLDAVIEASDSLYLWASLSQGQQGGLFLNEIEIVSPEKVGRIYPVYKGVPRVIRPETVAERVREALAESVDDAVKQLRNLLMIRSKEDQDALFSRLGFGPLSLRAVILKAHYPATPDEGWMAQKVLRRLATYFAVQVSKTTISRPVAPETAIPVSWSHAERVAAYLPYKLTDEQETAIRGSIQSLSEPRKSLIAYSADVGAGKTTLFGTVAVACTLVGAKVAILAPNTVLCEQLHKELSQTWPFVRYSKVWGANAEIDPDAQIFIGTTALINRAKEHGISFNLVVVDEEHRFSREQKEALAQGPANYIASTATPIPRTLQLASMGGFEVFRITKTHVKKEIRTYIMNADELPKVEHIVAKTIENGFQAFIVLPIAEGDEKEKITAEEAYHVWSAKYPGRIGLVHGKMKEEEKAAVLQQMRDGEIDILCATTVIEVGITIPKARTMVIYHPEVLGLATLHQLRGRLARKGGIGHFVLYLPKFISEKSFERLRILKGVNDGYKLAEYDLKLRGFGDLAPNAEKQTGGMPSLLPGYEVTVEDMEELIEVMDERKEQRDDLAAGWHGAEGGRESALSVSSDTRGRQQGNTGNHPGLLHV